MKIKCRCGAMILDGGDDLPQKAHMIPDQEWSKVLDAVDEAVETPKPAEQEREAACMAVRTSLGQASRLAWECRECGRLYLENREFQLREYIPAFGEDSREIFRSRPS